MSLKIHVLYVQCTVPASVLYTKQILQLGLDARVTVYQSLRENAVLTCSSYLERQTKYRQQIFVASWTRTLLAQDFFLIWRGGLDAMAFQHF